MNADKLLGALRGLRETRDRQRRRVRREDRGLGNHRLGLRRDVRLDAAVLEHGLDDQVAALEQRVVVGGRDARQQVLGLLRGRAAAVDALLHQLARVVLALLRGIARAVEQHHVHAGARRYERDARAHHAGAEDAELADARLVDALRPPHQLGGRALVDEQRARHVAGHRVHQQRREIFRFDVEARVDRHDRALVHR